MEREAHMDALPEKLPGMEGDCMMDGKHKRKFDLYLNGSAVITIDFRA